MHPGVAKFVDLIYPPQCVGCREMTDAPNGLCPACWRETSFITGPACDQCGIPVPAALPGSTVICEGCTTHPCGWRRGRAAILYEGVGRQVILRLKHGDRLDLAGPVARWMARAASDLLPGAEVIAPVPVHWRRMLIRRYNQAAELARRKPILGNRVFLPDLLIRTRPTPRQVSMDREARFRLQADAFRINPRQADAIRGKTVLLIDDVMTSGATLAACTAVLHRAGAGHVDVLVAARVARDRDDHI